MDSQASTAPRQSQPQPYDNTSDEKSLIPRHSPMTGRGRHLFELNGAESSLNIISTKGLKSTWWMLNSRLIYTTPSLHQSLKRCSLLADVSVHPLTQNNKLIEISTCHTSHGRLLFQSWWVLFELQYPTNEMNCSYVPRAPARLYLPFSPPPVLINSNPMSTLLPSSRALPSLHIPWNNTARVNKRGGSTN